MILRLSFSIIFRVFSPILLLCCQPQILLEIVSDEPSLFYAVELYQREYASEQISLRYQDKLQLLSRIAKGGSRQSGGNRPVIYISKHLDQLRHPSKQLKRLLPSLKWKPKQSNTAYRIQLPESVDLNYLRPVALYPLFYTVQAQTADPLPQNFYGNSPPHLLQSKWIYDQLKSSLKTPAKGSITFRDPAASLAQQIRALGIQYQLNSESLKDLHYSQNHRQISETLFRLAPSEDFFSTNPEEGPSWLLEANSRFHSRLLRKELQIYFVVSPDSKSLLLNRTLWLGFSKNIPPGQQIQVNRFVKWLLDPQIQWELIQNSIKEQASDAFLFGGISLYPQSNRDIWEILPVPETVNSRLLWQLLPPLLHFEGEIFPTPSFLKYRAILQKSDGEILREWLWPEIQAHFKIPPPGA